MLNYKDRNPGKEDPPYNRRIKKIDSPQDLLTNAGGQTRPRVGTTVLISDKEERDISQ